MIIAFTSKGREAGKDTAGRFVREWCDENRVAFQRIGFADKAKLLIAEIFKIRGTDEEKIAAVDQFKLHGEVEWTDDMREQGWHNMTGRNFIINLCGELGVGEDTGARKLFGRQFWTDMALPNNIDSSYKIVAVTDLRDEDEARRVHALGGVVLEIVNPRASAAGGRSEKGIAPIHIDNQIWNTGTIEQFEINVRAMTEVYWERSQRGAGTQVG